MDYENDYLNRQLQDQERLENAHEEEQERIKDSEREAQKESYREEQELETSKALASDILKQPAQRLKELLINEFEGHAFTPVQKKMIRLRIESALSNYILEREEAITRENNHFIANGFNMPEDGC